MFGSQRKLDDCTQLLIKHIAVWSWALDTFSSSVVSGKSLADREMSLRTARLLWAVRRSVRAFYESASDDVGAREKGQSCRVEERIERDWRGEIVQWASIAAEHLVATIAEVRSDHESAEIMIAAAMCWYMQTHANLGQRNEAASASCERALGAIIAAQQYCTERKGSNTDCMRSWMCSLCHAEILALQGRIKSEQDLQLDSKTRQKDAISILEKAESIVAALEMQDSDLPSVWQMAENERIITLPLLKCEVLNSLGNIYRVQVKGTKGSERRDKSEDLFKKAVKYYELAARALDLPEGKPNFVSHNIGLSLLGQYEALDGTLTRSNWHGPNRALISSDVAIPLLQSARLHLEQAVVVRSDAAHSKSFASLLRLCDSYRTLDNVVDNILFHTITARSDKNQAVQTQLSLLSVDPTPPAVNVDGQPAWLHRGRITLLGRLRRCARTWDDRTKALERVCMWMRHTGPFLVPEYPEYKRRRVLIKWRGQTDNNAVNLSENFAGLTDTGYSANAELAGEMLRTLTGLRLDAGATPDLALKVDPVVECLCDLAAKCVSGQLSPANFRHAVTALRTLVRAGDGEGVKTWGQQWRARVAATIRSFIHLANSLGRQLASPVATLSESPTAALHSPTGGELGEPGDRKPMLVDEPSMYVARLMLLQDEDLSRDEQVEVLRSGLAAVNGWAAVLGWSQNGGVEEAARLTKGNHQQGGPRQSEGKGPTATAAGQGNRFSGSGKQNVAKGPGTAPAKTKSAGGAKDGAGAVTGDWETWRRLRSCEVMYRELVLGWLAATSPLVRYVSTIIKFRMDAGTGRSRSCMLICNKRVQICNKSASRGFRSASWLIKTVGRIL